METESALDGPAACLAHVELLAERLLVRARPTLAFLAATLVATPALADNPTIYDNHQLYLVGSRAAGMGGAYTALACDEAALHYNPASLGCAQHSHLELVANAYMIQGYSIPRALGEGQNLSATTYHSIPSVVGGVYVLADGDPDSRQGRQAFGFSVSVPYSIALKADPTSPTRNFVSGTVRDDVLAGDVGYAYQVLPSLALGLSLGGLARIMNASTALLVTRGLPGGGAEFVSANTETEAFAIGARAKVGARWTPAPRVAVGLQVMTPTLDVYGAYRESTNVALGFVDRPTGNVTLDASPVRFTGKSAAGLPMRVALGGAYLGQGYTLSADVSVNLPHSVRVAYDVVPTRIEGAPDSTATPITLDRVVQPNVNVGAEVHLTRAVAVGMGAFTDLSSVPAGSAEEDRIHMFGLSAALSLIGAQTHGSFGASFSYGVADTRVNTGQLGLDTLLGAQSTGVSTLTRWNLVGVIGSNYSFLPDDVAAKASERPKEKPSPRVEPPLTPSNVEPNRGRP